MDIVEWQYLINSPNDLKYILSLFFEKIYVLEIYSGKLAYNTRFQTKMKIIIYQTCYVYLQALCSHHNAYLANLEMLEEAMLLQYELKQMKSGNRLIWAF